MASRLSVAVWAMCQGDNKESQRRLGPPIVAGGKACHQGRCTPPAVALAPPVAQELARQRPCGLSVLEGHLTVHHDPIVTLGFLDPSPLTPRQVLGNLGGRA